MLTFSISGAQTDRYGPAAHEKCANLTKNTGIMLSHSHQTAIAVLAVVFVCDSPREQRSVPLTSRYCVL